MKTTMMMKGMMLVTMMSVSTMMFAATGNKSNNKNNYGHGHQQEMVVSHPTQSGVRGHNMDFIAPQAGHQTMQQGHQGMQQTSHQGGQRGWLNGKDIRGYEGRVRYNKGVWSYYRNGRWYHYNHYIDARQYFSHNLSHWGKGITINLHF